MLCVFMPETGEYDLELGKFHGSLREFLLRNQGQSASILSTHTVEAPAPRAVRTCVCSATLRGDDLSYSPHQSIEWQEGVPPEILASLPESEVRRQTYDTRHQRSLLLNFRYLGLSARSSRRSSSTSKISTSSKTCVTNQLTYRVGRGAHTFLTGFHSPSTKCGSSCDPRQRVRVHRGSL